MLGFLAFVVHVFTIAVFLRLVLSWVVPLPRNEAMRFLYQVTDLYLDPFRRAFPFLVQGGFDLSPIPALIVLQLISAALRG